MIAIFLLLTLSLIYGVYLISKRKLQYWAKKKVPHLQPVPIFGNFSDLILQKKYFGQVTQKLCQNFPNAPFVGAYYGTEPVLIVQDPELIKLVMTKDFYFFSGREVSKYSHKELFTQNLFATYGDRWKVLRQNLTPLFSSAKMKNMFHLIENCSYVFENMLDQDTTGSNEIEVRTYIARYTMDCIGSCAFGVETNTMKEIDNNPFKKIGDAIFDNGSFRAFKNITRAIWPAIFYGLGFKSFPKEADNFFTSLLTGIFEGRQYKPTSRNDFVDLVLKLENNKSMTGDSLKNMKSDSTKKVTLEVDLNLLVAQCLLFFAAGYETSASTLSFTLFELAKNPEAQERALEEVDNYMHRHDNKLKYECVAELPYLEACIDEALRLYPVLGVLTREVVEDYTFPSGLTLEKGLRVHIPVYHMHYNPDFFPDPEQYRPERFLADEKKHIKPYTYMPFGDGPRICIDTTKLPNMIALFLLLTLSLIYGIYLISKRKLQYWAKKKVPHLQPVPIFGNFSDFILQKKYFGQVTQKLCQNFPNAPFVGAYYGTEPVLIVQDPELIKLVMTKDFYFFSGREVSKYSHRELFTQNLFATYGDRWKVLRQNLTPLFSSAKMKNMFHLIENCSHVFENMLDQDTKGSNEIEVRTFIARYTMDCIGSCAFGVETNTMKKIENNPFKKIGDAIFDNGSFRAFKKITRAIWPAIFYGLGFKSFPKEAENCFTILLTGIFEVRQYKPTSRNDFVDLVLKLKNNKSMTGDSLKTMKSDSNKKVTLEVDLNLLVAQCLLFFAAGYETSAATLSFTLFELAKNPEAQERALKEVDNYMHRHDNKLKYECVAELPYLEACINEALRLYPVLGVLTREVVEDYTFPSGLKLEKGLRVHIPVYHMHYNPDFFPEPEQYRPERFLADEKKYIKPYTYMPFGDGPRICIGMRFAKMQMMAGLITLLKKFKVELAPDMKSNLVFEPRAIVTQPIGGIKLKFMQREGWEERVLKSL